MEHLVLNQMFKKIPYRTSLRSGITQRQRLRRSLLCGVSLFRILLNNLCLPHSQIRRPQCLNWVLYHNFLSAYLLFLYIIHCLSDCLQLFHRSISNCFFRCQDLLYDRIAPHAPETWGFFSDYWLLIAGLVALFNRSLHKVHGIGICFLGLDF